MDTKFYYEETTMTLQQIADRLGVPFNNVWKFAKTNYSKEFRKSRKTKTYRASKLGELNPMFGKRGAEHHYFVGVVSDKKGYWMQLKPDWFTGRKHSKHIFVHHFVVCQALKLTEIPKGWNVHHCDHNPDNNEFSNLVLMTGSDHQRLHAFLKGATTISKESTLKWVEAHGTPWRDDIVFSALENAAAKAVDA